MKNLLFPVWTALLTLIFMTQLGCSTLGVSRSNFSDSTLSNLNPAPAQLAPPDYSQATPVLDAAYMASQADYHFTMGETLSFEGQSNQALENFNLVLIYDPKSIHVRLRMATEYMRIGKISEAIEQAETAVEIDPESLDARMLLGGLYSSLKMFGPATAQFEYALKIKPDSSEAAIFLGAILAEEKKYEEAIAYFESLIKSKSFAEPEKAYFYIGRVQIEQGESYLGAAKKSLEKALEIHPEYPEAALTLALLLRAQSAEKEMEVLLRGYQETFGPQREMARHLSHYYLTQEQYDRALEQLETLDAFERDNLNIKMQIALILIEQKRFEAAALRLEDVLQQSPELDKVRYYLGAVYEELGKVEISLGHYENVHPASPYFSESVIHSAHMLQTEGKLDKALDLVQDAVKKQPELPQLYAFLATLLDEKKAFKTAREMLISAIEKFPENAQLHFFLGTMHDRLGEQDKTITSMKRVLEIESEHVQALNYLAYTYADLGRNLNEAHELAQAALKLQPGDGYILDTIGWIHFKQGQTEMAIKFLEAAYKTKSDEAIIAEHLGDAYFRRQMWQKAHRMYSRAASLEKDENRNFAIQEKLAALQTQSQKPSRAPASFQQPKVQSLGAEPGKPKEKFDQQKKLNQQAK